MVKKFMYLETNVGPLQKSKFEKQQHSLIPICRQLSQEGPRDLEAWFWPDFSYEISVLLKKKHICAMDISYMKDKDALYEELNSVQERLPEGDTAVMVDDLNALQNQGIP